MLTALDYHAGFLDTTGITLNGSASVANTNSNTNLIGNLPAANSLLLTDNTPSEVSSFYFNNKQDISGFSLQFDYRITGTWPIADGMTFVIQNDPAGLNALGQGGDGLGYGASAPGGTDGVSNSVAVKFDIFDNVNNENNTTGLYTDGAAPSTANAINLDGTGVDLRSYDQMHVTMNYDGQTLSVTIKDTVTSASVTENYTVAIPSVVGGNTAWVGFTGASGVLRAVQEIDDFQFSTQSTAPSAPTGVTPTASNGQVGLSWTASPRASSYTINYGTAPGGPYTQSITGITGTSANVTGLTDGTPYYFVITAVNTGGTSPASTEVTATPQLVAPTIPTGLAAASGDTQALLSWNAVAGASTYTISYGTTDGGPYGTIVSGLTGTSTTITGLTDGTPYFFVISATNGGGTSTNSAQVSTTPQVPAPAMPTNVTPTAADGQVALAWDTIPGATTYNVMYGTTSGGPYTTISGLTTNSETVTGLTDGTTYYFVVTAQNAGGASNGSTEVNATPQAPALVPPNAPTNITPTAGNGQVTLTWTASPTATSYTVNFGTNSVGPFNISIPNISGTSTPITGLTNGVTYYFVVTANNSSGAGDPSAPVSATPQLPAPAKPTGVTATAGVQQVVLSWTAVPLAASYTVKYGTAPGGPYTTTLPGITGTGTTVTGLTSGTSYYFVVDAVNAGGTSLDSAEKTAIPTFPLPATPANVVATSGDTLAGLSWNAVPGATSYNIKYGTTNTGPYGTVISGVTGTSSTVTGLTDGTQYYFVVSAVGPGGEGSNSTQATTTPVAPAPAAPTGVTASGGDTQVGLSWTASAGATSYIVKYGTTIGGPYGTTIPGISGTSTTVTGLTDGTTYYFVVVATNSGGPSGNSTEANATPLSGVPAIPSGVIATPSSGQVALTWNVSPIATSYTVKYGTAPGTYTNTVPGLTSPSATIGSLTNGTTYYFVVTATGPGGESANSTELSATPLLPLPVAPTSVTGIASLGQVALSWNTVPTATGYTVKYGTLNGGPYTITVPVTGTSTTITGLTNDTTYYFVVSASNGSGPGQASTQVSATPSAALNFPTGFANAASSLQINGSAFINNGILNLTNNQAGEVTSVYGIAKQNVQTFTTSFDYQLTGSWPLGDGFTFVIQNAGVNAIGIGGSGLGYGASGTGGTGGIPNSIAIKFDMSDSQGEGNNSTGLYIDGAAPTNVGSVNLGIGGFNNFDMRSYLLTHVTMSYDGTTLSVTMTDSNNHTVTQNYAVNIPSIVGGNTAWIGFTAASGALTANQVIYDWSYAGGPATPATPAAPTGLAPVAGDHQVALSWAASTGATSYNVKYGTAPGGPYTTVVPVTGTSTTITGLTDGTTYYFVVSALNSVGEGSNSSQVSIAPVAPSAPAIPTGVTLVGGNGTIAVNWTAVAGATGYNVKYGTAVGGPYTTVVPVTTNTATLTGLTNGTTYYVVVTAINANGEGNASTEQNATPAAAAVTVDLSSGFASAAGKLQINGSAFINASDLYLTNNAAGEVSSVYSQTKQNITGFSTTFDYQLTGSWPLGDGFTFVIQNAGATAIGIGGSGLGYGASGTGLTGGINNSIAIKFDMSDSQGEGNNSTGLYIDGAAPTNVGSVNLGGTGFDMRSYLNTKATIAYDGTTLTVTLTDSQGHTVTQNYTVNIPAIIGSNTAWVGFTAASGALVANQVIHDWKYTTIPPGPAVPAAPTGVTPVAGNQQVALSWTPVTGATSYNVRYGTATGGPYGAPVSVTTANTTITGLTNGTSYYFVVSAVNGVGEGSNSTQVTAAPLAPSLPTAPTGLTATSGNTQLALNWTAVAGATSYNVKYGTTSGGPYTTVSASSNSFTLTGLVNTATYFVVVSAVNSVGESGNSSQISAVPSASQVTLNYPSFVGNDPTLKLNGSAFVNGNNLWLTNNVQGEVSSVYAATQQNITGFTTTFNFQTTGSWPLGDGFTFVIQRAGLTAIGLGGAGLGYGTDHVGGNGGIPNSVAIKFDVSDSQGEGDNSTGLFVNGAAPTNVGSVDLSGTGFDMRSYDNSQATISYDGTTLTVTLTDLVKHVSATQHYTINIPTVIGGTSAWVGFTAASGSLIANQAIQQWTYTSIPPVPTVPAAPTGLALTPGNGQIGVSWNSSLGATSYNVKYSTAPGGPYTVVPVTGLSTNLPGLTNGTTYYVVVSAINSVGEGANSGQISTSPVAPSAPVAPTGLTATSGFGQVNLSWTASATATSYNVRYGTASGGPYGAPVNVNGTTANIPGLTNGTTYYFVVSAVNGLGEGANSSQIAATPTASLITLNYAAGFPSSAGLTMNGAAQISNNTLLLTNNFGSLKANVYATQQQDITGFTTSFDYKVDGTWPLGDGFTFVIQRAGLTATGVGGGGLGYGTDHVGGTGGIPNSVAIKFDLYDNQGEGTNSTGLYENGAAPTNIGAIDLGANNSGFNIRSYDLSNCTITYDGTTLTVVMKDLVTGATATQNYTVDIPTVIGGTSAWVGFTAASGHFGANQAIYDWTYTDKPSTSTVPDAPTGVAPVAGVGQVALSWGSVKTAQTYNVKYGTTPGGPYTTTVPVSGTSTTITGLTAGTPYYFVVSAVNSVGTGATSSEVTATPVAPSAPSAPTGLGAAPGNNQAAVTWNASAGATSYNVKYGTSSGGPYATTVNVSGTSTTISNLINGTQYYFVVSAISGAGEGVNSTEASATPSASTMTLNYGAGFPSSAGLTMNGAAQINSGKLLLTNNFGSLKSNVYATQQQDVTGFTTTFDYKVDGTWPLGDGFTFVIQRAGLAATGVGGGGLGYGTDHVGGTGGIPNSLAIKFDFYDNQGEGTNSTGLYENGAAPTNVGAVDLGPTGFNLRSYDLSRASISYNGTTLTVVLLDLVTGATATQNYTVNIPAVIGGTTAWVGFTAASGHFGANQAIYDWTYTTVPVIVNPPAVPAGLTPTIGNGQVALSWNSVAGATSYNIKYGTATGGPYTTVVPATGNNATITGLTNGTPYYFVITAVNSAGEGAASTQVSATPLAVAIPVPSAPTGLLGAATDGQVALNWNPVAGAASYTVHYGTASGGPYGLSVTGLTGSSTTVSGLTDNTAYYFVVTAVNSSGESLPSSEITATPAIAAQGINFSTGFASAASALAINGSGRIDSSGNLLLTSNSPSQITSVFAKGKQNVAAFTTSFDFQITGSWPLADGFTFVIQNASQTAMGQSGAGLGYGATNLGAGIGSSVAIKFDINDNSGEGNNSTGLYINGATPSNVGAVNLGGTGFDLRSYDPSRATLTYDGTTLTVVLTDLTTGATATQHYVVNIPSIVGGNTAWVGFTASDGSIVSSQTVTKWTYTGS